MSGQGGDPEDRPPRHRGAEPGRGASRAYEALGLRRSSATHDVPTEKVRAAFLPVGESHLELLEPTEPASVIARFLEKRCGPAPRLRAGGGHRGRARRAEGARACALIDETPRVGRGRPRWPSSIPRRRRACCWSCVESEGQPRGERRSTAEIGIIGGSGLYEMEGFTDVARGRGGDAVRRRPRTRSMVGHAGGPARRLPARATRRGHRILPSELNFQANVFALKTLGVERILSVSAVGSLKEKYAPLHMVIPDQFVDRTAQRALDLLRPRAGGPRGLRPSLLRATCRARDGRGLRARRAPPHHAGGTYVCIEGPQFSTRAESELYRSWGMDIIGMTNLQEARSPARPRSATRPWPWSPTTTAGTPTTTR